MKTPNSSQPNWNNQSRLLQGWEQFWFSPSDPFGFHLFRLLTGILLLAWLLPQAGDVLTYHGLRGWFDVQAYRDTARMDLATVPKPISWSLLYLFGTNGSLTLAGYWFSIFVLVLFTMGIATRWTAVGAWLIVASFTASPLFDEEWDPFLQIMTFYLAIGYLFKDIPGKHLSWFDRVFGSRDSFLLGKRASGNPINKTIALNLAMRLFQVHFAMVILVSGLHKLQIGDWWSGVAHWYNLYPPLETTVASVREKANEAGNFMSLLNLAAYGTMAWQIAFPFIAWRSGWFRFLLFGGSLIGWLGLVFLYGLPFIGPALVIACTCYISQKEWVTIGSWVQRFSPLQALAHILPREENFSPAKTS